MPCGTRLIGNSEWRSPCRSIPPTCQSQRSRRFVDPEIRDVDIASQPVADRFERIMGSKLVAMFAPALFDEMMHPAVSASLVDTARIRDDPFNRARRTAASDQLAFFSHKADRQDEMERLVRLHRDLTGVQPDGKRYSALSPEPWNWNLISIFFMHRGVFIAVGGEKLSPADDQAIWDRFRQMCEGLQMPGRARELAERYEDLCAYYDRWGAKH